MDARALQDRTHRTTGDHAGTRGGRAQHDDASRGLTLHTVRAVLECAGIHDVLSKSLGSSNQINIVHATIQALRELEEPASVAARRGLPMDEVVPAPLLRDIQKAGA